MNNRRNFLKTVGYGVLVSSVPGMMKAAESPEAKRPNFVWLISEDNSTHYTDLYFETGAPMPCVNELAKDGVIFNHAFSVAPVCSAARSILATGCYGSRIGTQFHRKLKAVPLPEAVKPVYTVMRDAGYYTSNKKKTDYNFRSGKRAWNSSRDWRGRKKGQPFFHKQSFATSHEGQLHRANSGSTDKKVFVSPRHPDTGLFRQANVAYNKLVTRVDSDIARVVKQLEKDGLLEDTFIFYFGDHGGVLPGSKGYVYEVGLHVPLVVRIPENWKHLVDLKRGSRTDGFVEFIDFGATIMNLAGIKPPPGIDGKPFMGPGVTRKDLESRDETLGIADRFDEKSDLVRSLRKGDYKYIRSYQPFNFDGLQNNYRYKMAAYRQWRDMYKAGKLNEVQSMFFEAREPEVLYDVKKDPYETKDLAKDPKYAPILKKLRKGLVERIKGMPDLSMYPENVLLKEAIGNPVKFGQAHKAEIAELVDIADLSLLDFAEAQRGIKEALDSKNQWKRYWGLIVCSCFMKEAAAFYAKAKDLAASDANLLVRTRAAEFLALTGQQAPQEVIIDVLKQSTDAAESMLVLNTLVLLRDGKPGYEFKFQRKQVRSVNSESSRRLDYIFGKING